MFVDTNVLIYARFVMADQHESAALSLEHARASAETLWISRQVLREYLSAVTRTQPWGIALPMADALADAERLRDSFELLEDGPRVTERLLALCREVPVAGRQIHDANIVATMIEGGERRLLTFNAADFRRYGARVELVAPS